LVVKVDERKAWSKTCSYFGEGGREVYLKFYVGELPIFRNIGDGPIKWFFLGNKKERKKKR
jgi:hypothetical protein